MSEVTGKIEEVLFSISGKGNLMAHLWLEGMDVKDKAVAKLIVKDAYYLPFKSKGDSITIIKKNGWDNIVVPKEFSTAYNKSSALQATTHALVSSLSKAQNGNLITITLEEAGVMVKDDTFLALHVADIIDRTIEESKNKFAKELFAQKSLTKSKQTTDYYNTVLGMARGVVGSIKREHRLVDLGE